MIFGKREGIDVIDVGRIREKIVVENANATDVENDALERIVVAVDPIVIYKRSNQDETKKGLGSVRVHIT